MQERNRGDMRSAAQQPKSCPFFCLVGVVPCAWQRYLGIRCHAHPRLTIFRAAVFAAGGNRFRPEEKSGFKVGRAGSSQQVKVCVVGETAGGEGGRRHSVSIVCAWPGVRNILR